MFGVLDKLAVLIFVFYKIHRTQEGQEGMYFVPAGM
jgi:hypothetical protein